MKNLSKYTQINRLLARQPRHEVKLSELDYLSHVYKLARASDVPQFKMAAAVVTKNYQLAAMKPNSIGSHYVQQRWRPLTTHVHAEIACLISTTRSQLEDGTIYVERYKRDGKYSCTFPCHGCMNAILSTKLRWLVCRDEHEQPTKLDLRTVE